MNNETNLLLKEIAKQLERIANALEGDCDD